MVSASGLSAAFAGALLWGLSPLYWKHLRQVPALETLMHRVLWSALSLLPLVLARGDGAAALRNALSPRGELRRMALTTALVSANWFLYIWAINAGRVLEASLGYFINPLVAVALGRIFLGERLRRAQAGAIALACLGVANLVWSHGSLPWLALLLAGTFAFYALLRKTARVEALTGLAAELALLTPVALVWLGLRPEGGAFFSGAGTAGLLVGTTLVTGLPLWLYTEGVRRLNLKTVGMVQYVSPTCQFLLGIFAFGEPLPPAKLTSFALIWAGLLLYTIDAALSRRRN